MRLSPLFPRIAAVSIIVALIPSLLMSQAKPSDQKVAVLRMKSIGATDANKQALAGFAGQFHSALKAQQSAIVPDWKTALEVLDDEGLEPWELIDLDDYADAAEELGLTHFVVGSIAQQAQTLYSHARVYAMPEATLVGVLSADLTAEKMSELAGQMGMRVAQILQTPPSKPDYTGFRWSQQFSFAFGTNRYDLEPPVVYYVNDSPPFEISVKVGMDRLRGMYVVTHFEMYADGEPIAIVLSDTEAPRPLREREVEIDGRPFCFQATVKELRGRPGQSISTAVVDLQAQYCGGD